MGIDGGRMIGGEHGSALSESFRESRVALFARKSPEGAETPLELSPSIRDAMGQQILELRRLMGRLATEKGRLNSEVVAQVRRDHATGGKTSFDMRQAFADLDGIEAVGRALDGAIDGMAGFLGAPRPSAQSVMEATQDEGGGASRRAGPDLAAARAAKRSVLSNAFDTLAPGGSTHGACRYMAEDHRIVHASRVGTGPWQFQLNRDHLDWAIDSNAAYATLLLVCGGEGWVSLPIEDAVELAEPSFAQNGKGHMVGRLCAVRIGDAVAEVHLSGDRASFIEVEFHRATANVPADMEPDHEPVPEEPQEEPTAAASQDEAGV